MQNSKTPRMAFLRTKRKYSIGINDRYAIILTIPAVGGGFPSWRSASSRWLHLRARLWRAWDIPVGVLIDMLL